MCQAKTQISLCAVRTVIAGHSMVAMYQCPQINNEDLKAYVNAQADLILHWVDMPSCRKCSDMDHFRKTLHLCIPYTDISWVIIFQTDMEWNKKKKGMKKNKSTMGNDMRKYAMRSQPIHAVRYVFQLSPTKLMNNAKRYGKCPRNSNTLFHTFFGLNFVFM